MNGRLLRTITLACVLAVGILPPGQATARPYRADPTHIADRGLSRTVDFDRGWRFALVNPAGITDPTGAYQNAQDPSFDDSTWRTVDVPHDWSIELSPVSGPGTSTSAGTGFLQGGLGWYRKAFTLPSTMVGKRVAVEFDGVYMDSAIYLNGTLLGTHAYGYTGFSFDLSGLAHTDGVTPNVLAVKVQNRLPSSRWYSGSGIYRQVRLVVTDPIHVRRWGTYVTTPELPTTIASGYATVRVRTDFDGAEQLAAALTIRSRVTDADGRTVASAVSTPAGSTSDSVDIRVDRPTLWSFENPYLYTLETTLIAGRRTVDTYQTRFGIRYASFDPNEGFSLNGQYAKIQGVDLHHDLGALGSAVNRDAILRQMRLMKSMGVNALRTAHNPPSPEMIEVCEELGIVILVEAFDSWRRGKTQFDYGRFFDANSDADIKEMVNAAKNSPAVVMWSIGNEIPDSTSVAGLTMAQNLIDAIKSIDTSRPIVIGSDRYRSLPAIGSPADQMLSKLDGLGLNYNTASSVDALHARYPNLFLFESESSSETSTRGVYQEPNNLNTGENYTPGRRGTSSYDNNLASWTMSGEYGLKKDRDRKYFAGEFLWSGIDYLGEPTPYDDVFPVKSSFFGAVDTAGFPKDTYYLFKSQWTTAPMVHLLPMNWTDHQPGEDVQVWAYSNVDTVELFLNGRSLGVRTFDHKTTASGRGYLETTQASGDDKTVTSGPFPGSYTSPGGSAGKLHLTWDVPFAPGTLTAVARRDGAEVARDEVRTAAAARSLRLTPDRKVIAADGRSLSFVTAEVVDANGVVVPTANNQIDFRVSGGALVGVDNGQQESAERYQAPSRAAFSGKALAIVRSAERAGPITFTASSPGLLPVTTTLYAVRAGGRHDLVAIEPTYVRTAVNSTPVLPDRVRAVYADGSQQTMKVRWNRPPHGLTAKPGVHQLDGEVAGTRARARAVITVYGVAGIEPVSTVSPVGAAPVLPPTARVVYTDGVSQVMAVAWDTVAPERYATPGRFTVYGTVTGVNLRANALVVVSDVVTRGQNLAIATSPARPSVDASYSGSPNAVPAGLIDGNTTTGGWSNGFTKAATALLPPFNRARPSDWVAVAWPDVQRFATVNAYFTVDSTHTLPRSIEVTYWDGRAFVPVHNLVIAWAGTSNAPTTLTFDPIATTRVRITLTSQFPNEPNGHLQVAELEVIAD